MGTERYDELTTELVAAGKTVADRLEACPNEAAFQKMAVTTIRRQCEMITKLHEVMVLARITAKINNIDFKKEIAATREASVEAFRVAFNKAMAGIGETSGDVLGDGKPPAIANEMVQMPRWEGEKLEQLTDLFRIIHDATDDDDPRDIVLRAMATYRHFVSHARAGGQVKFVGIGKDKLLKVRLK